MLTPVVVGQRGRRDEIVNRLRDDIVAGRLDEGAHLSEVRLAERFGTSRGPIREALQQLTHEGLLVAKRNCGVTVAPAAPKAVRELIVPLRRTIEVYALRLIFDELGDADFERWEDILRRLRDACRKKDCAATAELDIAFHRSILLRAGQPDLLAIWQTIVGRIRTHFRKSHMRYADLMDIYREHRDLVETFRAGNEAESVKQLKKNIA
jgi:DNA-binding GntR family transcriptional regulator